MEENREDIVEDIQEDIKETTENAVVSKGVEEFNTLKETQATDVVRAVQNKKTMELIETDESVKGKVEENAKHVIEDSMKVVANESKERLNKSHFDLHKTASKMYGFKEERPLWQQKMMVIGSSIWFVIYFIIASFTVCPLQVFFDVLHNIFKKGWLTMIIAIIMYLAVFGGLPALIANLK